MENIQGHKKLEDAWIFFRVAMLAIAKFNMFKFMVKKITVVLILACGCYEFVILQLKRLS